MTSRIAPCERGMDLDAIARARDVWLDGSHHRDRADLEFAENIALVAPHIPYLVRAQRAMLRRMVRYLVGQGVKQFLDLGSGIPACGHVHEIAQAIDPACRVVYVDNAPGIAKDGKEIVADNDRVAYLCADFRHVDEIVGAVGTSRLIDLEQPAAVLLIETLLHLPDSDDPDSTVARYVDVLARGSYLGISHFGITEAIEAGFEMFNRMFGSAPPVVFLRDVERVRDFFAGLELVEPGLVPLPLWRPDPDDVIDRDPELAQVYAGLGRKV